MINLLPPAIKRDHRYARYNTRLLNWLFGSALALAGTGLIVAFGYIYMQQSINQYSGQVDAATNQLQVQKVEETRRELEDISSNTKLAVQVLSREILFSKLLRQLGAALPENTILKGLLIDKVEGGIQLSASARDFESASQIQVNLQDPKNQVFEKADINSITCSETSQQQYPCDIVLKALFGKNNQYFYIAPQKPSDKGGER